MKGELRRGKVSWEALVTLTSDLDSVGWWRQAQTQQAAVQKTTRNDNNEVLMVRGEVRAPLLRG